jgi:polygalacturonase
VTAENDYDVDACRNVRIANCLVNSPTDDGICLKSSFAPDSARGTDNVTITNCQVSGYDEGSLLDGTYRRTPHAKGRYPIGRIKLGTESNGAFRIHRTSVPRSPSTTSTASISGMWTPNACRR